MYVIGITGGVGSGKTEASHILAKIADATLLIADELGHVAMEKDSKGYHEIVKAFGEEILNDKKEISRQALSEIVFHDKNKLKKLNGIIHPVVKDYIRQFIAERKEQQGILVLENAIMFETGCDVFCDEIWFVSVSVQTRKKRLYESRGYSEEKCDAIMQKQFTEDIYQQRCTRKIDNNGSREELTKQLQRAFQEV